MVFTTSQPVPFVTASMIPGATDQRIVINNGNICRPHGITSWNTLRVGIRYQTEMGYGLGIGNYSMGLVLGLCNGDYNTGKNSIMVWSNPSTSAYGAAAGANMAYWNFSTNRVVFTIVNGAGAYSTAFGSTGYLPANPQATTRRMHFTDIIRGTPTFTANCFYCNSITAAPDVSANDFITQMTASTPSFTNHTYTVSSQTMTFSESNGVLDTAFVYWTVPYPKLYVSDFAVYKIA